LNKSLNEMTGKVGFDTRQGQAVRTAF
jgi:hypothetical protein